MTSTKIQALIVAMSIALSAPAQAAPDKLIPPAVPSGLEMEVGWNPFFVAHAVGTQNYICAPANTPSGVDWLFIGPQATAYADDGGQVLTHFQSKNPERANAFHTQWKDARVNELYDLERRTLDGPERAAQFKEMEERVHEGAPFIFLYHQQAPYAYRSNVTGFEVLPTSNYRLEDVTIK